jgi:hypothetical protein
MKAAGAKMGRRARRKRLKRLLAILGRRGMRLVEIDNHDDAGGAVWLFVGGNGCERVAANIDAELVNYCLGGGLLQKNADESLTISEAGRMAARRLAAGADPFILQHGPRKTEKRRVNGEERAVLVSAEASPLMWLARRKGADGRPFLDNIQLAAGERLARDFYFAGMQARVTSNWSGLGAGQSRRRSGAAARTNMSDGRMAALERLRDALEHAGPGLGDILLDICCLQIGLAESEKKRGWPRRAGKIILRLALDRLAEHYGLKSARRAGFSQGRILHWGDDGYRPSMDSHDDGGVRENESR